MRKIATVIKPEEGFPDRIKHFFVEVFGRLQGQITSRVMSPAGMDRAIAVAAISLGYQMGKVPPFVIELCDLEFGPFCAINAALEQTAVNGYKRMKQLIGRLRNHPVLSATSVDVDVERIKCDEQYHEEVFRGFSGWTIAPDSPPPTPRPGAPLDVQPFTVTAHSAILARARLAAYGVDAVSDEKLGELSVEIETLRNDPLIEYLREYAARFRDRPATQEKREELIANLREPAGA
jgi:hypothetical protein